jgi:cytochrome c oxidase subunit 2
MSATTRLIFALTIACAACGGCTGLQASMDPAGSPARQISGLWWLYCGVGIGVYVITMLFVLFAVRRKRRVEGPSDAPVVDTAPEPVRERRLTVVVSVAMGLTTIILIVLMFAEFATTRAVASLSGDANPMKIRIIARQWWWEVRYEERPTSETVITANEIHIPVGRTIQFDLQSPDVIHSFWVPKLSGKKDIIPGHGASLYLRAEEPGTYFGQCAEFCGYQHAKMRFVVVAESEEAFQKWRASQLQPANAPATAMQQRGQEVFLGSTCVMCHTVSGTTARGTVGPNLTHVASRDKIAAGSLPNTPGHLAGWITDPQKIKPGVRMPQHNLAPADLRALLEYLESLK